MMFVSNPLAGMATGWQWLPQPWDVIGQFFPIGSAGTLLRSTAYFESAGAALPIVVLTCWAVLGIALTVLATAKKRRIPTPTVEEQIEEQIEEQAEEHAEVRETSLSAPR